MADNHEDLGAESESANFQSILDSLLRSPADQGIDARAEDILYQYSRNQLKYHENMSLAFGNLFRKQRTSATADADTPLPFPRHRDPPQQQQQQSSRRRSENDNAALLVSYFFRHPLSQRQQSDHHQQATPPHLVIGGDVIARYETETAAAAAQDDDDNRERAIRREVHQFAFATTDDSSTVCGISQEPFVESEEVAEIRFCRHKFKPPLLFEWLRRSLTCPNCRHVLSADDTQQLGQDGAQPIAVASAAAATTPAVVEDPVFISLD